MKKVIFFLLCTLLLSGCNRQLPSLKEVNKNGVEWAQKEFQGYKIDDFLNGWGSAEDRWEIVETENEESQNGYLWFVGNDNAIAIIVYTDSNEVFQT